ncbi:MAG TPA: hypothetical protein PLH97_06765, partial [Verrucomicrobiota bacterium]|nr:hypothetical protein [Verrucomicrobiota bacterium]
MRFVPLVFTGCFALTAVSAEIAPPPVQWQHAAGAGGADQLQAVRHTTDGAYLAGGLSSGLVGGTKTSDGFGGTDFWVVRLDASGNQTWDKSYGGLSQDYLRSIAPAPEGGALLAGHSASDISGNKTSPLIGSGIFGLGDFWVVRIDASGNRLWDFSYGGNDDEVLYAA